MNNKKQIIISVLVFSFLFSACAHRSNQKKVDLGVGREKSISEVIAVRSNSNSDSEDSLEDSSKEDSELVTSDDYVGEGKVRFNEKGELTVKGVTLQNSQFDFPVTINSRVEFWVDYFLGRGRKHFERYLERSELFIPFIQPILRQNGLPEDLVYLAMIESGFNNHARSTAKAVGPWQFISATGKRYGLMINWWVDERRDTRKSTVAAAEYLRDLYNMFQSWELAAAAYNAGEAKVARAIKRYGTKDFWAITRQRYLKPETRDYVPKIIAAALIAKNRTQFGFEPSQIPTEGVVVAGDGEVVRVLKEGDVKESSSDASNEEMEEETILSVLSTEETQGEALQNGEALNSVGAAVPLAKAIGVPTVNKQGLLKGEDLVEIEVQSPADLLKISKAAGLAYQTVKSLNPELLRWCTPPSVSVYRIKLPISVQEVFLTTYNDPSFQRKVDFLVYRTRRGETVHRIASHFGIKSDPVLDLNGVSTHRPLPAGAKVLLPLPNDKTRTLASLDVYDAPDKKRKKSKNYKKKGVSVRKSKRK